MKNLLQKVICVTGGVILTAFLASCNRDQPEPSSSTQSGKDSVVEQGGKMKLGKKLEDPYTVDNMKKAWEEVKNAASNSRLSGNEVNVRTTHHYIKFKPKNEKELDKLNSDSALILYDHPVDREIENPGVYYRHPDVPEGQPTYQYCTVEKGQQLPDVEYDLISKLYIPQKDKQLNTKNSRTTEKVTGALTTAALKITGNLEKDEQQKNNNARTNCWAFCGPSKYRPGGRVTVWDDVAGRYIPVRHVEVRARRWHVTHHGKTDNNGNYSVDGTFRRAANYLIKWKKYHFSVRWGNFGQARLNGPKTKGDWNPSIGNRGSNRVGNKQQYLAHIFQAARDYYYTNRFGLASPPRNQTTYPQIKIAAKKRSKGKSSHSASYAKIVGGHFLQFI